jgi:hypothetical protein
MQSQIKRRLSLGRANLHEELSSGVLPIFEIVDEYRIKYTALPAKEFRTLGFPIDVKKSGVIQGDVLKEREIRYRKPDESSMLNIIMVRRPNLNWQGRAGPRLQGSDV